MTDESDEEKRAKAGRPPQRAITTPRAVPIVTPPTDQDRPPQPPLPPLKKQLAHTKPRTPGRGSSVVEKEMTLTYPDDRDRRRSDSAGTPLPASRRAQSQYESWEDMHTPPQTDAEVWRAVRQVGKDIESLDRAIERGFEEVGRNLDEQRVATMSLLTKLLDKVLEEKQVVVTSQVKVQETGALAQIADRTEDLKLKRKIAWKWYGLVLAVAFSSLVTALISKYL